MIYFIIFSQTTIDEKQDITPWELPIFI